VLKSAEEFKPNGIARFALNLAKEFSSYYHQSKILDDENEDLMATRLSLLHALQQTLKNALTILGIETPESMKFIRLFFTINVIFKRRYLNRNLVLS
jgi:arginyl-tRNA synthetase